MASRLYRARMGVEKREYIQCDVLAAALGSVERSIHLDVVRFELVPRPVADVSVLRGEVALATFSGTLHGPDGSLLASLGELEKPSLGMCRAELKAVVTVLNGALNEAQEGDMKLIQRLVATVSRYGATEMMKRLRLAERLPPSDIGVLMRSIVPSVKMEKTGERRTQKGKLVSTHVLRNGKPVSSELVAGYPGFITESSRPHEKLTHGRMKVREAILSVIAFHFANPESIEAAAISTHFMRRLAA